VGWSSQHRPTRPRQRAAPPPCRGRRAHRRWWPVCRHRQRSASDPALRPSQSSAPRISWHRPMRKAIRS
jgi:hypothetical protein